MRPVRFRSFWVFLGAAAWLVVFAGTQANAANDFRLKKTSITDACVECHDEFVEILKRPFLHTPVAKGDCAGCHNPHTSKRAML
ncbi:MAG: hypothetical protein JRE43_02205, partial [Deltaproteobacteria bacterium]|nr:hypothetical protein [Deltaproteobacteria bacterium]